jgi:hypothetical protein
VLYHLRHPLPALDIVSEPVGGTLVVQTLTMPGDERLDTPADLSIDGRDELTRPGWPAMAFVEHELAGDPTNWWAPNAACVEAMLRSCGLRIRAHPGMRYGCAKGAINVDPSWHEEVVRAGEGAGTSIRPWPCQRVRRTRSTPFRRPLCPARSSRHRRAAPPRSAVRCRPRWPPLYEPCAHLNAAA